jgi:hypothetical protein
MQLTILQLQKFLVMNILKKWHFGGGTCAVHSVAHSDAGAQGNHTMLVLLRVTACYCIVCVTALLSVDPRASVALCAVFVALSLGLACFGLWSHYIWYHMDLWRDWTLMAGSSVWFLLCSCSIIHTFLAVELHSSFSNCLWKVLFLQAVSDLRQTVLWVWVWPVPVAFK